MTRWGPALTTRSLRPSQLPGGMAAQRLGLRSASQEAALGFPVLFDVAVPALQEGLARGLTPALARLDTLFHVMSVLDDSNLARRGGLDGLRHAQRTAQAYLHAGGAARACGVDEAREISGDFVARRLSPGGAADALAAACWVVRVCGP
jgi:triphosphoribosyl-dephospho-CoA synthase